MDRFVKGGSVQGGALRGMVYTAILVAMIVLLGMTPIGLIPLGFTNVTILCVPVLIGTVLIGLKSGLVLGSFFGVMSVLNAFSITKPASASVALLMAQSPVLVIVMSMVPRLLVPLVAHIVYTYLVKRMGTARRALPFAAAAGSLTNTVFYLGLMVIFYLSTGIDVAPVLTMIATTAVVAGISEAVVAAVLVTSVTLALTYSTKQGK